MFLFRPIIWFDVLSALLTCMCIKDELWVEYHTKVFFFFAYIYFGILLVTFMWYFVSGIVLPYCMTLHLAILKWRFHVSDQSFSEDRPFGNFCVVCRITIEFSVISKCFTVTLYRTWNIIKKDSKEYRSQNTVDVLLYDLPISKKIRSYKRKVV